MASELSYCGDLVQKQDPDRFLLSLFAPAEAWEALWALFAFNYEIAKTREVVSETQLGLIRLQWWREAIDGIYNGTIQEHEIVKALHDAITGHDLPRDLFDTLIYAREFDLEDVLPSDLEGFLNYADYTHTPLLKLVAKGLGAENDPVQVIATNYTIAGILRSVSYLAKQRRCLLPENLIKKENIKLNQLYELKPQEGFSVVIKACADEFVPQIRAENPVLKRVQKLAELHVQQIKNCDYDPFHARLTLPPRFHTLRLWLNL